MAPSTDGSDLRKAALRWAGLAAEKQFANRKGHGGNPMLAERHLSRQQLQVLLAAAFEAGAKLTAPVVGQCEECGAILIAPLTRSQLS